MSVKKKIAIVHEKISGSLGGSEDVIFFVHDLYPEAPIYTTVLDRKILPDKYKNVEYHTTFLQNMPFSKKLYKAYFPLMPVAVETHNLQDYDVIFSSHHCAAKGIIPRPDAVHICYCHSPARYIWDMFWTYSDLNGFNSLKRLLISTIAHQIRTWDVVSANRVDYFLANSRYTAQRIKRYYNRDSEIVFPPVQTKEFQNEGEDDYYIVAGRLVAYKGAELAIEAFNESGKKLVVIGDGPEYEKLKAKASTNVELLGKVSREELVKHMNRCKGFIFPGKEDFGIVMAEAQAAGKPVIAFNEGGALDIVEDKATGILFNEQSISALNQAIKESESMQWDNNYISEYADRKFSTETLANRLKHIIENAEEFKNK